MTTSLPALPPGTPHSLLNRSRRTRDIDIACHSTVDVVVIGGGITGAGVALDAATRGLSVALVEQHDLAYGTSRWSSKLVHGGLRYLATGQVGIAWESARERARIMNTIAPHLSHPLAQVLPFTQHVNAPLVRTGLRAADLMRRASGSTLAPPTVVDTHAALRLTPAMTRTVSAASVSWDGQLVDDARLVVAVARTAAAFGAHILTHTRVDEISGTHVRVSDSLTGESWSLRARRIINATGAWADQLDPRVELVRSRGTHLIVPAARLGHPVGALAAAVPGSKSRFVFALPQPDDMVFIGLTDVPTDAAIDHPRADPAEVDFLLDTINSVLAEPLSRSDVVQTYSGYRPLLHNPGRESADLSRKHAVIDGEVISVVGGKLTTYRRMAEDAVDLITDRPCRTATLPLVGAQPWSDGSRLLQRFGSEAPLVAAAGDTEPIGATPISSAEIRWAVHAEGALTVDDVLQRRLRTDLAPQWDHDVRTAVYAELDVAVG